jgi:hypothetical protein
MNTTPPTVADRRYRVLALCDDTSTCEFCGRTDLQRVVAFEDTETGSVLYAGTTCAQTVRLIVVDEETGEAVPRTARELLTRAQRATREATLAAKVEALEWRIVELIIAANAAYEATGPAYPARISYWGYGDAAVLLPQLGCCNWIVHRLFSRYLQLVGLKGSLAKRERHVADHAAAVESLRVRWADAMVQERRS